MREWLARLIDRFRRDTLDEDLVEELRFHREHLERDARAAGAAPADASAEARRHLGSVTRTREVARDRWSFPTLDHLEQDLRYALRGLRRSPGFTTTVVITLALGIGANAAMFGVVDRLLFRPLAYLRDPSTVHRFYLQASDHGTVVTRSSTPYTQYLDMRRWTASFSELAAVAELPLAIGVGDAARERPAAMVSASYFTFFDARPALGRFFASSEDVTPRGADVVVLSYGFWQSEFGGRNVIGQALRVGEIPATIIGVAPEGFSGLNDANPPAVFVPITTYATSTGTDDSHSYYTRYYWGWTQIVARRNSEVPLDVATSDATAAYVQSWARQRLDEPERAPAAIARPHVVVSSVRPGAGPNPGLEARTALWVAGVAGIVLLIACANVANLFLARAVRRERETAVRLALGVSRARLMRQSITESLLLAFIGSAAGLFVAQWGGAAIGVLLMPANGERTTTIGDTRTLVVTIGLAVITGLITGSAPALLASRRDLADALRAGGRGIVSPRMGVRTVLLVIQAALSVVLLIGAALFVRSLSSAESMRLGYDADRVVVVRRVMRGERLDDSSAAASRRALLAAAQAMPEVAFASWASSAPFLSTSTTDLYVAGIDSVRRLGQFSYQATTPDYFRVMNTRIIRGRGLTADDRAGAPRVAVVSQSMANVLWPGREAIGQCMRVVADTMPCTTVVGVAEDMVQRALTATERYHYYLPIEQFTRTWGWGMLLRLRGDPETDVETVRSGLQRAMHGASYVTVQPLRDTVRGAQRSWRLGATMFVAFGVLALIVAAVGLYGVIGYSVSQRMHELGIRVALGAQRRDILRLIVGQSVRVTLLGIVVGIALALSVGRWVQPLLFHQSATDPVVFSAVAAVMIVVALGAAARPAIRAARADPNAALRAD